MSSLEQVLGLTEGKMRWVFIHITKIACLGFGHRPFSLYHSNLRHFLGKSFKFQRNKNKLELIFQSTSYFSRIQSECMETSREELGPAQLLGELEGAVNERIQHTELPLTDLAGGWGGLQTQ